MLGSWSEGRQCHLVDVALEFRKKDRDTNFLPGFEPPQNAVFLLEIAIASVSKSEGSLSSTVLIRFKATIYDRAMCNFERYGLSSDICVLRTNTDRRLRPISTVLTESLIPVPLSCSLVRLLFPMDIAVFASITKQN